MRGRRPVELAAAMVRDDDPGGAVLHGPDRIGRVEDALDDQRQVGQAAQPVEVRPGHGLVDQLDVRAPEGLRRADVRERAAVGERLADLPLAIAGRGQVDGQHDRAVAGRGGAPDHLLGPPAVLLDVELEPARSTADAGDILERAVRERREAVEQPAVGRDARRDHLGLAVGELLVGGRGEAERERHGLAQDRGRRIHLGDVDEDPRQQPAPGERRLVVTEGLLVPRAAGVVGEGGGLSRARASASNSRRLAIVVMATEYPTPGTGQRAARAASIRRPARAGSTAFQVIPSTFRLVPTIAPSATLKISRDPVGPHAGIGHDRHLRRRLLGRAQVAHREGHAGGRRR